MKRRPAGPHEEAARGADTTRPAGPTRPGPPGHDDQGAEAMKFTVDRAILLKALAHVQSVVERRNTIPILANVLLDAKDGTLTLTATDMEIAIVEEVAGVVVARPGRGTAPAATLFDIVRKLPENAKIELDHPGGDAPLALRAGRFSTSILALPVEDFPSMTEGKLPVRLRPAGQCAARADRPHPLRHLDRGDPLLPQRHLPARGRERRRPGAARRGDRRSPAGAGGGAAARRCGRHGGRDRAAQDGGRAAQAGRGHLG